MTEDQRFSRAGWDLAVSFWRLSLEVPPSFLRLYASGPLSHRHKLALARWVDGYDPEWFSLVCLPDGFATPGEVAGGG